MLNVLDIVNASIGASMYADQRPEQGLVLWARKVGHYRVFFHRLQIRLLPNDKFVVGTVHNSFRDHFVASGEARETIDEAAQDALDYLRDYAEAEADYRTEAYRFQQEQVSAEGDFA